MRMPMWLGLVVLALGGRGGAVQGEDAPPADEFATLPHEERLLEKDPLKRWFLIGPREQAKAPPKGHPLLLVLPGGDGSADFLPFVKRIQQNVLGKEWLVAQLVSPRFSPRQEITWPRADSKTEGQRFSAEEFVEGVLADAAAARSIDKQRVYALGWSSGGPPLYALLLQRKRSIAGFYIAQSVFQPQKLPPVALAKGGLVLLDHSPDDATCPFADAERAQADLGKAGAQVKLLTYKGGHGWKDMPFQRMKQGLDWLEEARSKSKAR